MQAMFGNHVCVCVCIFFFFFHAFVRLVATVHALCMNSSHKVQLFLPFFSQLVHTVHCSWTHKFHFSATFSLKMGSTVLFTHLKIILLQYFSVFSFSFQFSAVSKRTPNMKNISTNQTSTLIKSAFISNQSLICAMHQKMTKNEI